MRTALSEDDEEQYEAEAPHGDHELTVSATTLMVLFFSLVVLCGAFFGVGYTLGRREPAGANPLAPPPVSAAVSTSRPKPAATNPGNLPAPGPVPASASASASYSSTPEPRAPQESASEPAAPAYQSQSQPQSQPQPQSPAQAQSQPQPAAPPAPVAPAPQAHPAPVVVASVPVPPPAPVMVQIAAVSEQETANLLLTALKKRGYSVAIRHESGDSLLHVQVGPFATRADAQAMRQKLQNDGYAAIVR